jgi:hypothetical protein
MDLLCFKSIKAHEPSIRKKNVEVIIELENLEGDVAAFPLQLAYEEPLEEIHRPFLRLASAMPLMNYGLFSEELRFDFEMSHGDNELLKDLLDVFSRDIFVNKIARRRADYIIHDFLPKDDEITEENARPRAKIRTKSLSKYSSIVSDLDPNSCGVLSSGGKESLLTYCILKELGANVHPLYVNESGGHWRTALPGYRYHSLNEPLTGRVWTNVDRFYVFMLDNLRIIRRDHRRVRADTYPIRLCIFPFYVFVLLPLFASRRLGNLLIGSEFDDPRIEPVYEGIRHYYGVYDQTQDYDVRMEAWYKERMPGLQQWSVVRPVSGFIVEKVLTRRYIDMAKSQRSCHSCHFEGDNVVPCGTCTKCLGVILFLHANGIDPGSLAFRAQDVERFSSNYLKTGVRLDQEEKEHALHLASEKGVDVEGKEHPHVEGIHVHPTTGDPALIPEQFRDGLFRILGEYTNGFWILEGDNWVMKPYEEIERDLE